MWRSLGSKSEGGWYGGEKGLTERGGGGGRGGEEEGEGGGGGGGKRGGGGGGWGGGGGQRKRETLIFLKPGHSHMMSRVIALMNVNRAFVVLQISIH